MCTMLSKHSDSHFKIAYVCNDDQYSRPHKNIKRTKTFAMQVELRKLTSKKTEPVNLKILPYINVN